MIAVQKRIQEIDATLANNEAIQAAQAAVEQAEATLAPLQKRVRSLELDIEAARSKAQETEDRLYSGSVKNPKEMREMQQEITSLKTKQGELEEETLFIMEQIDDAETALAQSQAELERVTRAQGHQHEALVLERDHKNGELDTLQGKRAQAIASADPKGLQLYEQLKPRTRGLPVARMSNDGICGLCGVQQDRATENAIRRGTLTQCNNCRRILIF